MTAEVYGISWKSANHTAIIFPFFGAVNGYFLNAELFFFLFKNFYFCNLLMYCYLSQCFVQN